MSTSSLTQEKISFENLTDEQNMLLTQISYKSHILNTYTDWKLSQVYDSLPETDSLKDELEPYINAGFGDLEIKDVSNNTTSGFGAIAFTDSYGNTGFSYRGTDGLKVESLNDWVDNVTAMITGTSVQSGEAEAFFDRNKDTNGNNYIYGHSKGGELSESVFVNNYDDIKKIHLLNPQPINPYSLRSDQIVAINSDKVDIIVIEGDYVWFLGTLPSHSNIRIAKSNGSDAHLFDAISDMFDSNGNITPGTQPLWEHLAYSAISTITTNLQLKGSCVGMLYNAVVGVVDFAKEQLIPRATQFIEEVIGWINERVQDAKDFAVSFNNFLKTVCNNAKEWYNKNFNKGYIFASSNPYIEINTAKLRSYASRLSSINTRIANLDRRLDSLYYKVGFLDLWNLMQADLLTGYSVRLSMCVNYLEDTAEEFETVERSILSQI